MKNRTITILLIALFLIIIAVLVFDFGSGKIENRNAPQFEYNVDDLKKIDPSWVHYSETKQIKIHANDIHGFTMRSGLFYVLHDSVLKIFTNDNRLRMNRPLEDMPKAICVDDNKQIIIAFKNYFSIYDIDFQPLASSEKENDKTVFTSIAEKEGKIFIADAGNRRVLIFDQTGKKLNEIGGHTTSDSKHGFIVPSAYFDLGINQHNELWVVNPGKHQFQQYTLDGQFKGFWERTSMLIDGFSGCCNPAHFCFLPNADFVTSEKGMVRVKVHSPSGELKSVVAAPEKFENGKHAPDVCTDSAGNIYALDFDRKIIRVFAPNKKDK